MGGVESRVFFFKISLYVLPFVWVLNEILGADRQVEDIIMGFKGICAMLLP